MLVCKVVLAILFVCLSNAQEFYNIPEPTIEVFNAERFRISIEDSAGITFVAFHVNIKEELGLLQTGEFSKELFHALHGRWTFEVPNAHLTLRCKIYYWVFVIKDHMGYRKLGTYSVINPQNGTFEASGLQPTQPPHQLQPANCKTCSDGESQPISTTSPSSAPNSNQEPDLNICEQFLLNTTQNLLGLQSQLQAVRNSNQQLLDLLERYPDAKTLTLTANIPRTSDPAMTVRFIIREKLNLNPDIVSAVYISDNSIEFKVATVAEKAEISMIAKEKLVDSKFTIS